MFTRRLSDRLPDPELITAWSIAAGFAFAGIVLGYIVASASPLVVAVSVGAVFGILLLNALPIAYWILLVGVFLVSGPTFMFLPELSRTGWLFSILGFFLTGAAMLYPVLGREQPARPMPMFVWFGVAFVVWSIGLSFFSPGNLAEIIGGVKKYFQFWGVMFALAVVPFTATTVNRWLVFFGCLAVVQLPAALLQRLFLVPYVTVVNAEVPGFVPIDTVVGTFEGDIRGGGSSSVMAMFLVLVIAWLLSARRDNAIGTLRFWTLMVFAVLPLSLGETKLVVVLVPLAIAMVYLDLIAQRPGRFMLGAVIMGFVVTGFAYIYFVVQVPDAREISGWERLSETFDQNFGEDGYFAGRGLNRFTALTFWVSQHGWQDPVGTVFGHGLGSSYGAAGEAEVTGYMNDRFPEKLIGQTSIASILWDMGLTGFALFMAMFIGAWRQARRLVLRAVPGSDRALCRLLLAAVALCVPMAFYSNAMTLVPSLSTLAMLVLGTVAWRCRRP